MKKYLLFLFFLSSCGLEVPQSAPRLFPPNGLKVSSTLSDGGKYKIDFQGLNPESDFSGYNLYYTSSEADATLGVGKKVSVISNTNRTLEPTFSVSPPFNKASNFTYTLRRDNDLADDPFFKPSEMPTFHFFVRAYSRTRNFESPSSIAVRVSNYN